MLYKPLINANVYAHQWPLKYSILLAVKKVFPKIPLTMNVASVKHLQSKIVIRGNFTVTSCSTLNVNRGVTIS